MSSCGIGGSCGASQAQIMEQAKVAADTTSSGQVLKSATCTDGSCGSAPSTGSANGSCSGGSCGGGKAAYTSPGCSTGTCGSKATAKTGGSCGAGGCGDGADGGKKAQKSDCSNGQCDGKKGLFKTTIMTVAASELSQLTIDYSQYLS